MKKVQCVKGHYYDAEKFDECPVCKVTGEKKQIDDIGATMPLSYEDDLPLTMAIEATGFDTVPVFDDDDATETFLLSRGDKQFVTKPTEELHSEAIFAPKIDPVRCMNGHHFDRNRFAKCPVCGQPEEGVTIPLPEYEKVKEVAGWLVCVSGKYKGHAFVCTEGRNRIGNDVSFEISLTMESSVTREVHAYLIYEPRNSVFYLENGIGNGLVYLNDEILFSHSKLEAYDKIQIGKVTFVFVPLCGEKFKWADYAD